jgi:hypothetical protein
MARLQASETRVFKSFILARAYPKTYNGIRRILILYGDDLGHQQRRRKFTVYSCWVWRVRFLGNIDGKVPTNGLYYENADRESGNRTFQIRSLSITLSVLQGAV